MYYLVFYCYIYSMKKKFSQLSEDRQWDIVASHMDNFEWWSDTISSEKQELEELGFGGVDINFTGFWSQGDGASFTADSIDFNKFFARFREEIGFTSPALEDWLQNSGLRESEEAQFLAEHGFAEMFAKPTLLILLENDFFHGSIDRSNHRYLHENSTSLSIDTESYYIVDEDEDRDPAQFNLNEQDILEAQAFIEHIEKWVTSWMRNYNRSIYRTLEAAYESDHEENYKLFLDEDREFEESSSNW